MDEYQSSEEWLDFSELVDNVQEMIDLGLYDDAQKLLNQYDQMFFDEWEIYFLHSRILSEQNKPDEAIPYLHKGLRLDKTNPDCLMGLFFAHSMLNQVKKGGKYLLRAEKYHPDNEFIISALVWYYTELNELDTAILYFERLKNAGTVNPEAYRNGGQAYERSGNFQEAEECFKTALELNPQYDEVRDMLADHYLFQEQNENAIELYHEALKESPNNVRIMSRLVFCYSQADKFEQASSIAKKTIELYPNSPVGYVDLAYVHLNSEEYDKSIELALRALDISPIDPEAYRVTAICYSEKGLPEKAREAFEKAISLDPENSEIMRDYYHHLKSAGEFEEMEKWVQTVIKLEFPFCIEDYWFLAEHYKELGQNAKSFHFLHKAYKNMPAEKELIPPMVDILLEKGHTAFIIPFLRQYVEKSGWNDVMDQFAKHKRLKGKWSQEGVRFLHFWKEPISYRKFVFSYYMQRFIFLFVILLSLASMVPLYLLLGIFGVILSISFLGAAGIAYFITRFIIGRKKQTGIGKLAEAISKST